MLLSETLLENPKTGISIGNQCYKIRLNIKSKGKGKRGGGRVISFLQIVDNKIYLVSIYDKSERPTISNIELINLLKEL